MLDAEDCSSKSYNMPGIAKGLTLESLFLNVSLPFSLSK